MMIEGTGLEGKKLTLADLDYEMNQLGFARWSWEYNRATYDYKYEDQKMGEIFYLRVPVVTVKGEIEEEGNESIVEIHQPYLGRWTHPHGLDYEYNFPSILLENAKRKLSSLNNELGSYSEVK